MSFFHKSTDMPSAGGTQTKTYGNYYADFGMYQEDYPRLGELLTIADRLYIDTQDEKIDAILPFYNVLKALYFNFRPLINEPKQVWFQNKFILVKGLIKDWKSSPALKKKIPYSIINEEESFYSELLMIKQVIGLGFKVSKKESEKTKIARAFGLHD